MKKYIGMLICVLCLCLGLEGCASAEIASGTWGTCPWEIGDDGVLTIHPKSRIMGTK